MVKLYFLPITEQIEKQNFNKLVSFATNDKQEQIERYHFDIDKKLSLYSELIVIILACQTLNVKNSDIVIEKEEHGKPYIKGYPNFHYNISHARNAIVMVISDFPIGVDIEKIRKAELGITKRFFAFNERAYFSQVDFESNKRFYEVWTKKESYIKYLGQGLSMPLNSFDVLNTDISDHTSTFEKDGYIISVCSEQSNPQFETIELTEKEAEDTAFSLLS